MRLVRLSIDRPVTMLMFYIAVVFLGFVSLKELSVDLLPDVSYPRLSVVARYTGVAPEEIESLITAPLESAVSRIPGLRRVESVSKESVAYMTLEFGWGTDMDFALLHTREKLDSVTLPEDAEKPTIIPLDPQSKPIIVLALSGENSLLELKEFAEELVKPRLEQVEGIGSAEITGGVEREIQVEVNPRLLALYGLTIDDVAQRISAFNRDLQGGTIRKGKYKYALRVVGEFEFVDEVGEISLKTTAARGVVRLKDIATVNDSVKKRQGMTRLNGEESIGLLVRKESGANTVKITRLARAAIEQIKNENPQLNIQVVSEQSKYIEKAISSVISEIIQGAVLAFLVLLIFLQEWKTPLIIDLVIPISIIGTFNLLYFNNISLNIMSLGGLALGVGMLDDCAIVVSENIFRHRNLGQSRSDAAYSGTKEVGTAVTATALTTIVVFLPVIYVHGVAGQIFKATALTVTFSLLSSLLVSLTLLPMLASRKFELNEGIEVPGTEIIAVKKKEQKRKKKIRFLLCLFQGLCGLLYMLFKILAFFFNFIFSFFSQLLILFFHYLSLPLKHAFGLMFVGFNYVYGKFVSSYINFLDWSLNHKRKILAGSGLFFAAALLLETQIRQELLPKMETASFEIFMKTPVDYSLEQTEELVAFLERLLKGKKPVRLIFSQVGIVSGMESLNPDVSLNTAQMHIEVHKPSQVESVLENLRRKLADFPDLQYSIIKEQSSLAQFLSYSTADVGLKVKGDDLARLKGISEELVRKLRDVEGIADISADTDEGKPEFLVKIRKEALEKYADISPALVGNFLVNAVRGSQATQFRQLEKSYDIIVRLQEEKRENVESLLDEQFPLQSGSIPLRELVRYELIKGPKEIHREDQQREILVTANLKGKKISQVLPAVKAKIKEVSLGSDYQIAFSGEEEEMRESFQSLIFALILAILLNYMIMAAQFESLLHPFLVLLTLPMGAAGALLALFLTGQTLNVISIIGMVVLVGIVVDNAIVKIDFINQLRKNGKGLRESVIEASHVRLRPILMSTLSTIFGLVPMSLGMERGAELLKPLGIVVSGGLIVSTFLTLILIPVVYELAESKRMKIMS